jgi:hypothetical protein
MTQWWLARWLRGAKRARALRGPLHLEPLEERNLLTQGLVFVPSPIVSRSVLLGAASVAANDMWAVGYTARYSIQPTRPLVEHFDGTKWSVVPNTLPNDPLVSVAAAASNDVWAVGTPPFIAHWDGTSWSVVASPTLPPNSSLTAVTAPAANNAWVVGNTSGSSTAVVEHWDGRRWRLASSPAFKNVSVQAISADSSTDVWAFGASTTTGNPEALHFNGTTWTTMPAATSGGVFKVGGLTALSPTDVWAAGGITTPDHVPLVPAAEHWDGTRWSLVSVPNPNPGAIYYDITFSGIAAIAANDIWAVGSFPTWPNGNYEHALTEHWDGTSWSIIPSPTSGGLDFLHAVSARSDGSVVAVGSQGNIVPLIYQNAASAPKAVTTIAAPTTTMAAPLDAAPVMPAGTTTADHSISMPAPRDTAVDRLFAALGNADQPLSLAGQSPARTVLATPSGTMPAPQDARAVDLLFAAAGMEDQTLSLARHSSRAHKAAANGDLDALPGDIWL